MNETKLHIIGHQICPYVQRVIILMKEKHIPYIRTDIELDKKPEWLASLSPAGKVPALIINETQALFESNVICEYLDDVSPTSLHPSDPFVKASHRAWIVFASDILDGIAKLIYSDMRLSDVQSTLLNIAHKLRVIEPLLSKQAYFCGDQFHLIDAVYATVFRYFSVLSSLTDTDLFAQLPNVKQWSMNLAQRPSVQAAVPTNYNELLLVFIKKRDNYIGQ